MGRRLAFDGAKGRLWVVCRKCKRWNLTPLEERWEAIVPFVNGWGGTRRTVRAAVDEIASHRHPSRFLSAVARQEHTGPAGRTGYVKSMPRPTRLALEMALHEERERRALEGELWILEQAWREAEEIAGIADNLLLPAGTDGFFKRQGRKPSTG